MPTKARTARNWVAGIVGVGVVVALGVGLSRNTQEPNESDLAVRPPSQEAIDILRQVENRQLPVDRRASLVRQLVELNESGTSDRLIALLPGEWDALTVEVVQALGRLRASQALPTLREMAQTDRRHPSGAVPAAIHKAIEAIEGLRCEDCKHRSHNWLQRWLQR
jgi:hypothetical protein